MYSHDSPLSGRRAGQRADHESIAPSRGANGLLPGRPVDAAAGRRAGPRAVDPEEQRSHQDDREGAVDARFVLPLQRRGAGGRRAAGGGGSRSVSRFGVSKLGVCDAHSEDEGRTVEVVGECAGAEGKE